MENKIDKNPFKGIDGGRKDEISLTEEERRIAIREGIKNQNRLTKEETLELVSKIHKDKILGIKKDVLSFRGKILSDDEAEFIKGRLLGLVKEDQKITKELHEKFPDLVEYFDNVLMIMKDYKKEKEDDEGDK
jgi:hypothetical protein